MNISNLYVQITRHINNLLRFGWRVDSRHCYWSYEEIYNYTFPLDIRMLNSGFTEQHKN
jgi:hypothetical protein